MSRLLSVLVLLALLAWSGPAIAQAPGPLQALMQEQGDLIRKSSRRTVGPAIDALAASGPAGAQGVLERWQAREIWSRREDGLFVFWPTRSTATRCAFPISTRAPRLATPRPRISGKSSRTAACGR